MSENVNHFKVVGISHHLASVEVREKFSLHTPDISIIHQHLGSYAKGGFVLSTCNRTEIYFIANSIESVVKSWADLAQVSENVLRQYLYVHEGKQAIEYLFRVGTGLDSQILGDFQIIGQIKNAYKQAMIDGANHPKLTRLVDTLLRASKRVKNETALSSGVASMSYSAVQHVGLVKEENWSALTGLVYGAGKMGTAVVRKLSELMPASQVFVANRTISKAKKLADKFGVMNVSNQSLCQLVDQVDFVISAAAGNEPIFTKKLLQAIDLSNKVFIDLSMPRSVAPNLIDLNTRVINLDFLQDIQNETFQARKQAIPAAEAIVSEELTQFFEWIKAHEISPTIHALKQKLQIVKDVEVKRLKKEHKNIHEDQIDQIAEALINKVTTQCVKHVKKHNGQSLSLINEIFELENKD